MLRLTKHAATVGHRTGDHDSTSVSLLTVLHDLHRLCDVEPDNALLLAGHAGWQRPLIALFEISTMFAYGTADSLSVLDGAEASDLARDADSSVPASPTATDHSSFVLQVGSPGAPSTMATQSQQRMTAPTVRSPVTASSAGAASASNKRRSEFKPLSIENYFPGSAASSNVAGGRQASSPATDTVDATASVHADGGKTARNERRFAHQTRVAAYSLVVRCVAAALCRSKEGWRVLQETLVFLRFAAEVWLLSCAGCMSMMLVTDLTCLYDLIPHLYLRTCQRTTTDPFADGSSSVFCDTARGWCHTGRWRPCPDLSLRRTVLRLRCHRYFWPWSEPPDLVIRFARLPKLCLSRW